MNYEVLKFNSIYAGKVAHHWDYIYCLKLTQAFNLIIACFLLKGH
jgi:hypothetical protein